MVEEIYCVGRNYDAHARKLGNEVNEVPIIFSKPRSSLIAGTAIALPDFSDDIHFEAELVIRISRCCVAVGEAEAHQAYDAVAVGLDLTARDLQSDLREKGLPWFLAKGFRDATFISTFHDRPALPGPNGFHMTVNGETRQRGFSDEMVFSFAKIISFLSQYVTLQPGDVIFTGTPAGVGRLGSGDQIVLYLEERPVASLAVQ